MEGFFEERREQSAVKARIVQKYFWAWAKIIAPHSNRIAYIDLFAGPGRYKDHTVSTPLLILEQAAQDPEMREKMVTIFNDRDEENCRSLEAAIQGVPDIGKLKHKPQIRNHEVGTQIVAQFEKMSFVPTLMFVDPWGYKGLSLRLVNSVLKDWACEAIFFFNYNRINAGLGNAAVAEHMDALFGAERAAALRPRLQALGPRDRELTIVEELVSALHEMGGRYVLPFTFKNNEGTRTSHHLFFVTKHRRGYDIMKEVMAKESSDSPQGVASFQYSPADQRFPKLFALSRPLEALAHELLTTFAGRTVTVKDIIDEHSVGTPYVPQNYKAALIDLEATNAIACEPTKRQMRNGKKTMGDKVRVAFPPTGG